MKIGIFSDRYLPQTDGVSHSIETYRIELEKLGHEVYIFAPRPSWRYKERSGRIIRFAAIKGLFFDDWLTSIFFPPQAIKQIEKLNLDIIHFQTPGQIGFLGAYYALRHNVPLVTTYHTDLYEYVKHYPQVLPGSIALSILAPIVTGGGLAEYRDTLSSISPERSVDKWNQKIVVHNLTLLHNHCDLVIVPSRKMQKQLLDWGTSAPLEILPTGVDEITTKKRDITLFRKKYNITETDKVVSFVGRIGTEKNIGLLIDAFDYVAEAIPSAKLVIVGPGDDLDLFREQASKSPYSDRVIFTGFVDRPKLGALYNITSVFAFPSLADTQGMVVNEAACTGLPIVMVDPEVTEVVKNNINGYFTRNTPKAFSSKIISLLKDDRLRSAMSKESIKLASEYSATHQASKLLNLYDTAIAHYQKTDHTSLKKKLFKKNPR